MRNFFVHFIVLFNRFLSISFPFKPSLTSCFPSVPEPSVAVYVVRKQRLVGIDQRASTAICVLRVDQKHWINQQISSLSNARRAMPNQRLLSVKEMLLEMTS